MAFQSKTVISLAWTLWWSKKFRVDFHSFQYQRIAIFLFNKIEKSILKKYNVLEKVELFESNLGQQKIWCWLVETDGENKTSGLHISRRTKKGQIYANQEITLSLDAINSLKQYLEEIKICNPSPSNR